MATPNLVTRPLDAVRQLFEQTGGNAAGDWGVSDAFRAALADSAALAEVNHVTIALWLRPCSPITIANR